MLDIAALSTAFSQNDIQRLLPLFQQQRNARPEKKVKTETFEVLNILHKRGQRMGIVSNYTASLSDFLLEEKLTDFFETIVISEVVGVEKPDPHIMQIALEKMNVKPAQAIYVGDHPFDVLCAILAGMDCVWIAAKEAMLPMQLSCKETYRIQHLRELTAILS